MGTMDYIALEVSSLNRQGTKNDQFHWHGNRNSDACQPAVALDCDGFQVRHGEIFGILGADSSSKSALVRCLAERLLADEGRITISGQGVLRDETAVKRLINRVLADASFFQKLTPLENLLYGARLYSLGEPAARACAIEVLKQMGFDEETMSRPVEELSTCVQQEVAAACASLTQPALLLLYEPTRGLPPTSRQEVQSFMEELRDGYNATILLTTRDVWEAETLCDRVAILNEGQIVAVGTPEGLKDLVPQTNGHTPTLADALVQLTSG
jgi:ABC-2 type transport system ATP-binding protein